MDATTPLYSLAEACAAAGLDPRYVRRLLAEYRIVLLAQPFRRPGEHVRVSIIDALRLAVLRRLRDAGLDDGEAVYVLDLAVDPLLGGLCGCGCAVPLAVLRGRVVGASFHVIPSDDPSEPPDVYSTPTGMPVPDHAAVAITFQLAAILFETETSLITSKEPAQ